MCEDYQWRSNKLQVTDGSQLCEVWRRLKNYTFQVSYGLTKDAIIKWIAHSDNLNNWLSSDLVIFEPTCKTIAGCSFINIRICCFSWSFMTLCVFGFVGWIKESFGRHHFGLWEEDCFPNWHCIDWRSRLIYNGDNH